MRVPRDPDRSGLSRWSCRCSGKITTELRRGVYPAYVRSARTYRDPQYKRWTCLLRFDVLNETLTRTIAHVPFWLNLGDYDRPNASRRGRYFAEWCHANGGPPRRRDRLSDRVFCRRMTSVEVGDTLGPAPYSVVRRILVWENRSVLTIWFRVHKSISQPVKGRARESHAREKVAMKRLSQVSPTWRKSSLPGRWVHTQSTQGGRDLQVTARKGIVGIYKSSRSVD